LLQYDIASLLKDAYFKLEEYVRDELLDFYLKILESDGCMNVTRERFVRTFHRAGLQRNMQALGAFAVLSLDKGKTAFAAHVPCALFYLRDALKKFPEFSLLQELSEQAEIKSQSMKS
jgi:hypothetical protein